MTLLGKENCDWSSAKKEMTDVKFILKLKEYDLDHIPDRIILATKKYTS